VININFNKEELIKSPLNYIGGKFKLLPQILPLFPDNILKFYDIFGGGCNVCPNVKSEHKYFNDVNSYLSNMFKGIQDNSIEETLKRIDNLIQEYDLHKTNKQGFEQLRSNYNNGLNSWEYLFVLICHSFNYQVRFNNKHQYNSSFRMNRIGFTDNMRQNLIKFSNAIHNNDIKFDSQDFREIDYSRADKNDLVYFDPPYLLCCGVYQDGKRGFGGWNEKDEVDLYYLCDKLNEQGTRFAMSNVIESKGQSNDILKEWASKYKIHILNADYTNSNYHRESHEKDIEVLITNYIV
jgi:DNA adenine methylase Dam